MFDVPQAAARGVGPHPARRGRRPPPDGADHLRPELRQGATRCSSTERIEQAAPHLSPDSVRAFVQQALVGYIRENPGDINKPDAAFRRVPLNFPRPAEAPARNAQEWVARRAAADERILWNKTCAECHVREDAAAATPGAVRSTPRTNITARWMPKAGFDHTPHLMV
jgi:hypothetical protein